MIQKGFYIFLWIILCVSIGVPVNTHAASDSFTIKQAITVTDITPPSTPVIASVTPVTSSQIDVVWAASTDNHLVSGYQVFRDASQVATTTLLSFSDTGLTASTTYTYTVRAFDSSNNFSTTSAGVSTTTPVYVAVVSTTTPTTSTGGRRLMFNDIELVSLTVSPKMRSVTLDWETSEYSRYSLRWGRTTNYELGYVQSELYAREHSTTISDLDAGTVYEYELIAYDDFNNEYILSRDQFTTKSGPDTIAPANVSNLQAELFGSGVVLSWNNPPDHDFSHVNVVRSHYFYPTYPSEGFLVYNNDGTEVFDTSPFTFGRSQFYTVFAYDTSGNRSSGAVVMIIKPDEPGDVQDVEAVVTDDAQATSTKSQLDDISFGDFEFVQDGVVLEERNEAVRVDGSKPLTIRLPYDLLPRHLKSIVVAFTHPGAGDQVFSFLLRVNKDSTAYEATIAPLFEEGIFAVDIAVFDYIDQKSTEVSGSMRVVYAETAASTTRDLLVQLGLILFFGTLLVIMLIKSSFFLFARRRKKEKA